MVQCIVIGPVCLFVCLCVFVGLLPQLENVCIDPHQTVFVGKGSDHLQLIKFWPSHATGNGVCGGAKMFGSTLLQPAPSVCISLSAFSLQMFFKDAERKRRADNRLFQAQYVR